MAATKGTATPKADDGDEDQGLSSAGRLALKTGAEYVRLLGGKPSDKLTVELLHEVTKFLAAGQFEPDEKDDPDDDD